MLGAPDPKVPPRTLPIVYFSCAHLSLLAATLLVAVDPGEIAGFFYHSRMFVAVHLVTLGWITCSILGATYLVAPFAMRTVLPVGRADTWICVAVLIGVAGIVSHFWIEEYSGIASSAVLILIAAGAFSIRVWRALMQAKSPIGVRLIVGMAYGNLLLATIVGLLLGINKILPFLPGNQFAWVFGHVHLAVVGWATMMVVGVGYRLIPMFMPAAPPEGRSLVLCGVLLEGGLLGLFLSLPVSEVAAQLFAVVMFAGLAVFFFDVVRMARNPRKPPVHLPRPDLGMLHAFQALAYLLLSAAVGLYLLFTPGWQLGWVMVYGVCGLLGFLGQIVLGMGMRLLPMFSWMSAFAGGGFTAPPPPPHEMPSRPLQHLVLVLWTVGVPALAVGLGTGKMPWVTGGAWVLCLAAVLICANTWVVFRKSSPSGQPA